VERVVEIFDFLLQFARDFEALDAGMFFGKIRSDVRFRLNRRFVGWLGGRLEWLGAFLHRLCGRLVLRFGRAALHGTTILPQAGQAEQAAMRAWKLKGNSSRVNLGGSDAIDETVR
jgi:hypothetical protein